MGEQHIEDKSRDASYFVMIPQIVWAKCKDPYDLALWTVIKMVAGENGECWLNTRHLAALAMMSVAQVSRSRARLLEAGLLRGEIRQGPNGGQPVWHLSIPDLWAENLAWRQKHHALKERVQFKRQGQCSQGKQEGVPESGRCSQEKQESAPESGKCFCGEPKNIQSRDNQEEEPSFPEPAAPEPTVADALAKARERDRLQREAWSRMHAAQEPDDEPAGWQAPASPEQHEFLEATGAKRFETGQKRQIELIEALMDTAMVMGEQAWTTLESYLARAPAGAGLDLARLPCLPQLWWDDRLEQARKHRWSRKGLLKALLNREKLMEFVRRQVRQMQKGGRETYDRRTGTSDPDLGIDDPSALVT